MAWNGVELRSIECVRALTLTNSGRTDGITFHGHEDKTCLWSGILHLTSALLCAPAGLCYRDVRPGMIALQAVIQQSLQSWYFMKHSPWEPKRERASTFISVTILYLSHVISQKVNHNVVFRNVALTPANLFQFRLHHYKCELRHVIKMHCTYISSFLKWG